MWNVGAVESTERDLVVWPLGRDSTAWVITGERANLSLWGRRLLKRAMHPYIRLSSHLGAVLRHGNQGVRPSQTSVSALSVLVSRNGGFNA